MATLTGTGITFSDGTIRTSAGAGEMNELGCIAAVFYGVTSLAAQYSSTQYGPNLTASGSVVYYNVVDSAPTSSYPLYSNTGKGFLSHFNNSYGTNIYLVLFATVGAKAWESSWGTQASGSWRFLTTFCVSHDNESHYWEQALATRYA